MSLEVTSEKAAPKQGDEAVQSPPVSVPEIDLDVERQNDLHSGPQRPLSDDQQEAMRVEIRKAKMKEAREAEKAAQVEEEKERARKSAMLYTHKQMIGKYKKFYKIQDFKAALNPTTVNKTFVDIFDDLLVLNRIMRDDKRGRWADAWEFGVGVVFGILILIGSIFIAMDASKENPILCETTSAVVSGKTVYTTMCDEAANKIGTAGMLSTGSWIVVAGGLGFILVFLWRIIVKIRLARKHHATLLTFIHDFATDGSNGKVEEIEEARAMDMFNDESRESSQSSISLDDSVVVSPKAAQKSADSRFYRNVPSFYAPRSAYHRVARGYGSPLMC